MTDEAHILCFPFWEFDMVINFTPMDMSCINYYFTNCLPMCHLSFNIYTFYFANVISYWYFYFANVHCANCDWIAIPFLIMLSYIGTFTRDVYCIAVYRKYRYFQSVSKLYCILPYRMQYQNVCQIKNQYTDCSFIS